MICGEQIDFLKAFQSIGWTTKIDKDGRPLPYELDIDKIHDLGIVKPNGFYTNWFKFDPLAESKDKKIEITINDKTIVDEIYANDFYKEYEKSFKDGMTKTKFEATKVSTRLVYLSDLSNLEGIKKLMRVGIWEVSNV